MSIVALFPPTDWCQVLLEKSHLPYSIWNTSTSMRKEDVLLIVDVFEWNGQPYSVAGLWHLWLAKQYPEAKLLVAGWRQAIASKGYVDLLKDGSPDWEARAVLAKEAYFPTDGQSGLAAIKRLVDGHGEDSLLKGLSRLLSFIDTLLFVIEEQEDDDLWEQQKDALFALSEPLLHDWQEHQGRMAYTPLQTTSDLAYQALYELHHNQVSLSFVRDKTAVLFGFSRLLTQWQQWLNDERE